MSKPKPRAARSPIVGATTVPIDTLSECPVNPRRGDVDAIVESVAVNGQYRPLVIDRDGVVVCGNHTLRALKAAGVVEVAVTRLDVTWDSDVGKRIALADNRTQDLAVWDERELAEMLGSLPSLEGAWPGEDLPLPEIGPPGTSGPANGNQIEEFGEPLLSILDSRSGRWQAAKKDWLERIGPADVGRPGVNTYGTRQITGTSTTSGFDPYLVDRLLAWFCPEGGRVYDPFAGGPVRGAACAITGRTYLGVDLREEQVVADQLALKRWGAARARVVQADSTTFEPDGDFDMILTCPPYLDLEVYSDDPRDLSRMRPGEFDGALAAALGHGLDHLRDNRFFAVVTGDVIGRDGSLDLWAERMCQTLTARPDVTLVNRCILVTVVGSAAMTAKQAYVRTGRLARTHQYVYVFAKGDPRAAIAAVRGEAAPE